MNEWLNLLNTVGATFWRGFPYDIVFLLVLIWGAQHTESKTLYYVAVFMAILIAINLTIGTVPAWFQGMTW